MQREIMENGDYVMIFVSLILSITSITMLAACLCCRKKVQNNELLGLEGMVKIKNPDENHLNGNHSVAIVESETKLSINDITDSKRSLNVPHRSLPDIPISDPNQLDTNSELYATVGDKVGDKPQGQSLTSGAKKQISISQHSSISQADDCSSPYARVRSPSHAYDKVRQTDHPYAQVKAIGDTTNRPSTSNATISSSDPNNSENNNNSTEDPPLSRRSSHESLLDSTDGRLHQVIPAASAIAGRVSASQELPYMTPPIVQSQQYFSGDSQDSSKGYTSISVREPLANIIAQTKKQNAQSRRRQISDSHYATVSDDSDEMYAAIEDPNNPAELLYTSGSETYAQIQPQESLVVSVEINQINPLPNSSTNSTAASLSQPVPPLASHPNASQTNSLTATTPRNSVIIEPAVDMLKASAHSRQASSSSCTSSVGNLGSPKPEKRQANSPLPPTPKSTQQYQSNSSLANSAALQSGRSSVASVIDTNAMTTNHRHVSRENLSSSMDGRNMPRPTFNERLLAAEDEPKKNRLSKDLEGMYAKVMKKNKLSNAPSVNTSPVPIRKTLNDPQRQSVFLSDPDITVETTASVEPLSKSMNAASTIQSIKSAYFNATNEYETIDKRRARNSSSNYDSKNDPCYETIPADQPNSSKATDKAKRTNFSRQSAPPGMFLQKLSQSSLNTFIEPASEAFAGNYGGDGSEPGYESLPDQPLSLSNDPGYETLGKSNLNDSKKNGSDYDPNYETLRSTEKSDSNDGYSSIKMIIKNIVNDDDENLGYCTISEDAPSANAEPLNHDYASICETTKESDQNDEEFYSSIILHEMESPHSILRIETKNKNGPSMASTPSSITLSPNTALSASICSTVSDTKTLTSPSSDGDSTSTLPIGYNPLRSTDRSQLTVSVSNYESLTGSESDSNYESVRYLNADNRENPYEQLFNESDIKYDTLRRDNTSGSIAGVYASKSNESNNSSPSSTNVGVTDGRTSRTDGKLSTSSSFNVN